MVLHAPTYRHQRPAQQIFSPYFPTCLRLRLHGIIPGTPILDLSSPPLLFPSPQMAIFGIIDFVPVSYTRDARLDR